MHLPRPCGCVGAVWCARASRPFPLLETKRSWRRPSDQGRPTSGEPQRKVRFPSGRRNVRLVNGKGPRVEAGVDALKLLEPWLADAEGAKVGGRRGSKARGSRTAPHIRAPGSQANHRGDGAHRVQSSSSLAAASSRVLYSEGGRCLGVCRRVAQLMPHIGALAAGGGSGQAPHGSPLPPRVVPLDRRPRREHLVPCLNGHSGCPVSGYAGPPAASSPPPGPAAALESSAQREPAILTPSPQRTTPCPPIPHPQSLRRFHPHVAAVEKPAAQPDVRAPLPHQRPHCPEKPLDLPCPQPAAGAPRT